VGNPPSKTQVPYLLTTEDPGIISHYTDMCTVSRKKDLSKQSDTTCDEIFWTGQKNTNLEKASTVTKIAKLSRFVRVNGPTKSIAYP